MQPDPRHSASYSLSTILTALPRLILIGAIVLCIAGAFAYVGGWLSPNRETPSRFADTFEQANGHHPGFRRNHAKGVCITGTFASNGKGADLSKAIVFQEGSVPVVGRLALSSGIPDAADGPKGVRSMGLSFGLPNGEEWRTGMNDISVFPFATPADLEDLLRATTPDAATGKPDPEKVKAYFASHPKTAQALQVIGGKPFSSGFANGTYNGLDAFRFVNAAGTVTPVRWSMVASDSFMPEPADKPAGADNNYLFEALQARVAQGPVQWHLVVTVGQAGDPTNDATIAWPADRQQIDVGTLTIDRLETEAAGNCRDINYDPLVLPSGIEASDDPLLSARSAVYAQSFRRRSSEEKQPSAFQVKAP